MPSVEENMKNTWSKKINELVSKRFDQGGYGDDDDHDAEEASWGEDLIAGEEDRNRLSSLPEIEREKILYERSVKRQRRIEKDQLFKRLEEQKQKRSPLETSHNRSLDELKEKRARKKRKELKRKFDEEDYLAESSENESIKIDRQLKRKIEAALLEDLSPNDEDGVIKDEKEEYISLEDAHNLQLTRTMIESWMFLPFFAKLVPALFTRVLIGRKDSELVYRCTNVIEITKYHRPYRLGKQWTDRALKVQIGKVKRTVRLDIISNAKITERELNRWNVEMKINRIYFHQTNVIERKKMELENAKTYHVTEEDISEVLKLKRQLAEKHKKITAIVNITSEKVRLLQLREIAVLENNTEELATLDEELKATEENAKLISESKNANLVQMTKLNERNRQMNKLEVKEAELKHNQSKRTDGKKDYDPFARRKPQSMIHAMIAKNEEEICDDNIVQNSVKTDRKIDYAEHSKFENDVNLFELHKSIDIHINI